MEHEPLARREADVERPPLPGERVAVEREARPVGLGDLVRTHVGARRGDRAGPVVAAFARRHREHAVVVDPHDLHRVQVDDADQAADGPRIGVVALEVGTQPRQAAREPAVAVLEAADRPRVDHDHVGVLDPSPGERLAEARVGDDRVPGVVELVDVDRGMHAGHVAPVEQAPFVERDDRLVRHPVVVRQDDEERLARRRARGQRLLGRLAQLDRDEPHPLAQIAGLAHDGDRCDDLVPGQRIERSRRDGRRGQRDTRVLDWLSGWTRDAHSRSRPRRSPLRPAAPRAPKARPPYGPPRRRCGSAASRSSTAPQRPFAGGYRPVLGVVAAPPAYLPQVVRSTDPRWPYWEKAGMVVRANPRAS